MKKVRNKVLAYILVFVMAFSAANVPVHAKEGTVTEVVTENEETVADEEVVKESASDVDTELATENAVNTEEITTDETADETSDETDGSTWDEVTTENMFAGGNFRVTYTLSAYWDTGYNANVKIENTGDSIMEDWYLEFESENKITNVWNAEIFENAESKYVIKNAGWNQDIPAQGCVEFGISGEGMFQGFPETYELVSTISEMEKEGYLIEYTVDSDWGSGFTGNIKITNNTESAIEDWVLEFDYDRNIENLWNGVIEKHEGNHYVVRNAGHNSNIAAGQTVSFGFTGTDGTLENEPSEYALCSYGGETVNLDEIEITIDDGYMIFCESESGDYYHAQNEIASLSGKAANVQKADAFSYVISDGSGELLKGTLDKNEAWTISGFGLGFGYNSLVFIVKAGEKEKKFEFNIVNTCMDNMNHAGIDYKTDTDGDGVSDYLEAKYNLNPNAVDTDGDGLDDYMEMLVPNLSPTELDGDENGVLDADEDYDGDGLCNYDEVNVHHTDYSNADTDNDRLSDYDEIYTYGTNPNKKDSDDDGVSDFDEIMLGTNPVVVNVSFRKTKELAADDDHSTSVKVTVDDLSAEQVPTFDIGRSTDFMLTDKEIPGYIDDGYNFVVDGSISGATVEVSYDVSLEGEGFEPALYYFNEEVQLLELVENQSWENGKLTAQLEHFSKYILINKKEYTKSWNHSFLQLEDDVKFSGLDIAFVIDDSGSMSWNDRLNKRGAVTREFINKLTDHDRASIISFTSEASTLSGFTSDKKTLLSATQRLYSNGGTNLSNGISRAIQLFRSLEKDETRLRYIVMLTDGEGSYSTSYSTQALNDNVVINTIGLGSSVSSSVLLNMAEETGGQYYHIDNADELVYIFESIAEKTDYYKDTDNDGISDYYEKEMAAGRLVLGNGVPLTSVSYLNPDSDGDGIMDGDEIFILQIEQNVFVKMTSNPGVVDSDHDGIDDLHDEFPLAPTTPQTLVVYQTRGKEGIDKEQEGDRVAPDLTFNDRSYAEIVKDCAHVGVATGINPEYMMWARMATLFFLGNIDFDHELEAALMDLYYEFRYYSANEGVSVNREDPYEPSYYHHYSDAVLTDRVQESARMDAYVNDVKKIIINKLKAYNGDLSAIAVTGPSKGVVSDEINANLYLPSIGLGESVALTLAVHDFQGHNVTVEDFVCNGNHFSGTIRFHFYDHFGLDDDDYQWLPGFCDWYVLQHYDGFNGKYCPFITIMDFSCNFEGTF